MDSGADISWDEKILAKNFTGDKKQPAAPESGGRPLFYPTALSPGGFDHGKGLVVMQFFPDMPDVHRQAVIASDGYLVLPDRVRQLLRGHNTPSVFQKKAEDGKLRVG